VRSPVAGCAAAGQAGAEHAAARRTRIAIHLRARTDGFGARVAELVVGHRHADDVRSRLQYAGVAASLQAVERVVIELFAILTCFVAVAQVAEGIPTVALVLQDLTRVRHAAVRHIAGAELIQAAAILRVATLDLHRRQIAAALQHHVAAFVGFQIADVGGRSSRTRRRLIAERGFALCQGMAARAELGFEPTTAGIERLPRPAQAVELHRRAVADLVNRGRAAVRATHRVVTDTAQKRDRLLAIVRCRQIVTAHCFSRHLATTIRGGVIDHVRGRFQQALCIENRLGKHPPARVIALADALALAGVQRNLLDYFTRRVVDRFP